MTSSRQRIQPIPAIQGIKNPYFECHSALLALLFLMLFQNIFAISLAPHHALVSLVVLGLKDVLLICCYGILLLKTLATLKASPLVLFLIFIIASLLVASLLNRAPLMSARQLLIIPLFMSAGIVFSKSVSFSKTFNMVLGWSFLVAVSGAIEIAVHFLVDPGEQYWSALGINAYLALRGMSAWAFGPNGVPGNFYSYDLLFISGAAYRRVVGIIAEPTLMGHILILPTVYFFITRRLGCAAFCAVILLLTLSKGGIAGSLLAIASYYVFYTRQIFTLTIVLLVGLATAAGIVFGLHSGGMESILIHLSGLTSGIHNLVQSPFGHGIGASGNFANLAYDAGLTDYVVKGGSESFFGTVIGQTGIFGVMAYALLVYAIGRIRADDIKVIALKLTLLATLFASLLSESAISYIGSGLLFLLLGVYLSQAGRVPARRSQDDGNPG